MKEKHTLFQISIFYIYHLDRMQYFTRKLAGNILFHGFKKRRFLRLMFIADIAEMIFRAVALSFNIEMTVYCR